MSRGLQFISGIFISILTLAVVIYLADWSGVGDSLAQIELIYLIHVLIALLANFFLRAVRWRFLLPSIEEPPSIRLLFDSIVGGAIASMIFPLRAGEFVRPYILSRFSRQSFGSSFASVVIERFFDLLSVVLTFVCLMSLLKTIPDTVYIAAQGLALIVLMLLFCILIGSWFPSKMFLFARVILQILPLNPRGKILILVDELLSSFAILHDLRRFASVLILSIAVWFTTIASFWYYLSLCGIEPTWIFAVALAVFIALSIAVPSAPGFVGVYQAGCLLAFSAFEQGTGPAVAFSIVSHVVGYALVFSIGMSILWYRGLSLSFLRGLQTRTTEQ